jgi:hypothetical protein
VHVRVPDDAAVLKPGQITVETWVFPTLVTTLDHQTIIACGSSKNSNQTWLIGLQNGFPQFFSHGGALLNSPLTIPLSQWTHLAITFDGTTKRLYVNGAQVARQGGMGPLVYDPSVPVTIGSDWARNASNTRFTGRVDEVAIYNRALAADEVWGIYNADFLGKKVSGPYFTSPSRLPDVAVGGSCTQQLTTILGRPPVSFSLSSGMLPPGVALSSAGLLSGVPSVPGTFALTVEATDAVGESIEQLCVQRIPPPADLVAWWPAEPAADSTVPDLMGGHVGGFFSGTATAPPSYTSDGKVGNAFAFDGTRYVQVPDAPGLRPPELTAEAWVFPTVQSPDRQTIIAHGSDGSTNNQDPTWLMGVTDGMPQFVAIGEHGTTLSSPSAIPLTQWTHLAITFDGTTERIFINGTQVASADRPGSAGLWCGHTIDDSARTGHATRAYHASMDALTK